MTKLEHLSNSKTEPKVLLSPYGPSNYSTIKYLVGLAKNGDVSIDLGCADGEVPLAFGKSTKIKKALGIECNPYLVDEAITKIEERGMQKKVEIIQNDILRVNLLDIVPAPTLVTMYFTEGGTSWIGSKLEREGLKGTRVFTISKEITRWKPIRVHNISSSDKIVFEYEIGKC